MTMISSGRTTRSLGTDTDDTVLGGGTETVIAGATAIGTTLTSGGTVTVSSGGVDSSASVGSGGSETVLSGGSATDIVVGSGGFLRDDGTLRFDEASGTLHEEGTITGSGAIVQTGGETLLLDGSDSLTGGVMISAGLGRTAARRTLRGQIDRVRPDRVQGWAQDPLRPEAPVCLDVLVEGVMIARTLANRYRADLKLAGLGSGRHSFDVPLPASAPPPLRRVVEVRRSADGAPLVHSTLASQPAPAARPAAV
ncbi:MAG: hypothetical protein JO264_08030 [Acidisphaera sp.]|nr:hypothetical protein [Acidisphaera sp.]